MCAREIQEHKVEGYSSKGIWIKLQLNSAWEKEREKKTLLDSPTSLALF